MEIRIINWTGKKKQKRSQHALGLVYSTSSWGIYQSVCRHVRRPVVVCSTASSSRYIYGSPCDSATEGDRAGRSRHPLPLESCAPQRTGCLRVQAMLAISSADLRASCRPNSLGKPTCFRSFLPQQCTRTGQMFFDQCVLQQRQVVRVYTAVSLPQPSLPLSCKSRVQQRCSRGLYGKNPFRQHGWPSK